MSKISDGITNSGLFAHNADGGIDAIKKLGEVAKKVGNPKAAKKVITENLKIFAKYPLVDLNWLLALAEHYKVTETEEWQIFKRQMIYESKQKGETENEEFTHLGRADDQKVS